jgi:hypothetical protein
MGTSWLHEAGVPQSVLAACFSEAGVRLRVGTWWVNSGADFDPDNCVPTSPGSFVLRVARTPHYDGVIAGGSEPR